MIEHAQRESGLTRRQLILRGSIAAGGLLIGGLLTRAAVKIGASPAPGLMALSEKEREILIALLETMFPGAHGMPAAEVSTLVPKIDDYLAHSDEDNRLLIRSMLHVVEDHALVFRFSRFTRLSPEERVQELRAWEVTPIYSKRATFQSLKFCIGLHYCEQPSARDAMGWYIGCSPGHLNNSHTGV